MSEQFQGQPLDQAQSQNPHGKVRSQSPIGLPGSESLGTPRPPRLFSTRLGRALLLVPFLAFGCLIFWNATRPYFYLGYFALAIVAWIRSMARRRSRAQRRAGPPLRRD